MVISAGNPPVLAVALLGISHLAVNGYGRHVEAVGKGVTAFSPGNPVFGWSSDAFAEYTSTPASRLVQKAGALGSRHDE